MTMNNVANTNNVENEEMEVYNNSVERVKEIYRHMANVYSKCEATIMLLWVSIHLIKRSNNDRLGCWKVPVLQLVGDKGTGKTMCATLIENLFGEEMTSNPHITSSSSITDMIERICNETKKTPFAASWQPVELEVYKGHEFYIDRLLGHEFEELCEDDLNPIILTSRTGINGFLDYVITIRTKDRGADYDSIVESLEFIRDVEETGILRDVIEYAYDLSGISENEMILFDSFHNARVLISKKCNFNGIINDESAILLLTAYRMLPDDIKTEIGTEDDVIEYFIHNDNI